jgi:Fe2+ transport system protein B
MESGSAPEQDCALEQKPRVSLTNTETQFIGSPAIGLVAALIIWSRIYLLVFQIGEEWKQASELVFTFLCSVFGLTQENT